MVPQLSAFPQRAFLIGRGPKRFIDQTLNLAQPIERFLAEFVRSGRLTLGEYGTS
jgi:hypothetical protein